MGRGREKSLLIPNEQQLDWIQLGSGAVGAVCCPRNPPGCCCPAPSGRALQGEVGELAEIAGEKGHTSPALLCWPLCRFPQFSQHLGFLLGLHTTPALLPAVAWIQPACISQSLCFRYHLFLGCPTCSKDEEPRSFQRSQHEKQGFKKKERKPNEQKTPKTKKKTQPKQAFEPLGTSHPPLCASQTDKYWDSFSKLRRRARNQSIPELGFSMTCPACPVRVF